MKLSLESIKMENFLGRRRESNWPRFLWSQMTRLLLQTWAQQEFILNQRCVQLSKVPGQANIRQIIDFCIHLIFLKKKNSKDKIQHLLCQGFQRDATTRHVNRGEQAISNIPGVVSIHPNHHVASMKSWPWPQVLALFGKQGEMMMVDLILDCGIFVLVENTYGSYYQLSGESIFSNMSSSWFALGQPLGELDVREVRSKAKKNSSSNEQAAKTPSSINFVRSRMMYARAATNQKGDIHFGLRHNRKYLIILSWLGWPARSAQSTAIESQVIRRRGPEKGPRTQYYRSHDVHIPKTIRSSQCLHRRNRYPADNSTFPGLYFSRHWDGGKVWRS